MKLTIIGLGYVGLPLAVAFAKKGHKVIGFDVSEKRITELKKATDRTNEVKSKQLKKAKIHYTSNIEDAKGSDFFIICVPTPVDERKIPDLMPVIKASETVGRIVGKGAIVVLESTVYPGVTEELVGPTIEKISGLRCGIDFKLGYSPERANPGDRVHTLKTITKVVAGQDKKTTEKLAKLYGSIVNDIYKAKNIKVAEAAKVIENTQRDINIALMNELAMVFDKMSIDIWGVLDAAKTKWNFLDFTPGLVGGHCIPVDPYYLLYKAKSLGFQPRLIASGRMVSDGMDRYVIDKILRTLADMGTSLDGKKVLFLGVTFKENVPDMRNSIPYDIAKQFRKMGADVVMVDPIANDGEVVREIPTGQYDIVMFAVPHKQFLKQKNKILKIKTRIFFDVKGVFRNKKMNAKYLTL